VFVGEIGPRQADLDKLVRRLQAKTPELVFAYEAGPCGYGLHRYLTGQGFRCQVVAPSLIPKKPGDKLEAELRERAPAWRLYPVVQALQALRGVQCLVAIAVVAELGDLTRFASPRQLGAFVGVLPSEDSSGPRRRLGAITKTGNGRARRALVEGAWAYRHPAKVSEHIQRRIDALPKPIQDIGWKAQVRLCKRFRRLVARGKHPNVAVTPIARELIAFMWAIAKEVPITT
jgi:transposase